jgi:hypothetical protein
VVQKSCSPNGAQEAENETASEREGKAMTPSDLLPPIRPTFQGSTTYLPIIPSVATKTLAHDLWRTFLIQTITSGMKSNWHQDNWLVLLP